MPKVKLWENPVAERNKAIGKAVKKSLVDFDSNIGLLAEKAGMNRSVLSKRINHGGWSVDELMRVAKELKWNAEDLNKALRI